MIGRHKDPPGSQFDKGHGGSAGQAGASGVHGQRQRAEVRLGPGDGLL